jgi:hypothetical protein
MESILLFLNNNKLFFGLIMIFVNIGGKYIWRDMPKSLDYIFDNVWLRRFVIFCMLFIATHDIQISILLTLIIVLILHYLLHEKSPFHIKVFDKLDLNKDGNISGDEIDKVIKILQDYLQTNKDKEREIEII